MADRTLGERLQPSLLDRLTDLEPGQLKEGRENRAIDISRLREIVQRDLAYLLNTNNMNTLLSAETYPHVMRSVLNFGVREVSGEFSTVARVELIRASIEEAITVFEPRIAPGTVQVEVHPEEKGGEMFMAFNIRAEMWAQPVPLELYLRSRVDLTTGEIDLDRQG